MNTIENKKIIAEFMGYANNRPLTDGLLETLYNDWNSLMEVVEKIFEMADLDNDYLTDLRDVLWDVPNKEAVYNACLEFIKWYNQVNKK